MLFVVELVHGYSDAGQGKCLHSFAGKLEAFVHLLQILLPEFAQHVVNLAALGEVVADAET